MVPRKTKSPYSKKGTILVLCHRRTHHLQKVLDSLVKCTNIDLFTTIFVVQDPIPSVMEILDSYPKDMRILTVDGSNYSSPAQAINGNLYKGLNYAFAKMGSEFIVVLEDDIVLSKDALIYYSQMMSKFSGVKHFRGINGFSTTIPSPELNNAYVKNHFGLGWGWAIDQRNFKKILSYWKGDEDDHWDFIFEPYIRSGFIVSPLRSRILNIGFDETATHTSADMALGHDIYKSFMSSNPSVPKALLEVDVDFYWRGEILNHSKLSAGKQFCFHLLYYVYYLFGNSVTYHRIRRFFSEHKFI